MKPSLVALVALLCTLLVACAEGARVFDVPLPGTSGATPAATRGAAEASPVAAFPTGPAVLVANDYQAPKSRVDSTGAFLPANGKPTMVWVDAIW